MYNFFVLESGDKWARTGTKFRPRNSKGLPSPGALVRNSREVRDSLALFFAYLFPVRKSIFENYAERSSEEPSSICLECGG